MHTGIDISRIATMARTGTEQYTCEVLAAIARHDLTNTYTLYCQRLPTTLPPLGANMRVRCIPLPRLWTHVRLSVEVLRHAPDVLFIPAHVLPLGAPLVRRMRTVVTIHDLGYLQYPEAHTTAQRLYLRLSTVWSARAASHLIAVSEATRNDLVRLAKVSPARVTVVHHGVADRFRQPVVDLGRARKIAGGSEPYFLYVGTVQPRKNLERVIEAFADASAQLTDQGRTPVLVIAGKRGWLSEQIAQRAAALGIADRVRFVGYVADEDLPALYRASLAFVFPSLYEGFGMPVLEAMACGAPVLTSNSSSLPEVAGDAALLVDPHDTRAIAAGMVRLARDEVLRQELRQRGYRRAAQFTWDRCAEETLRVLYG
jgi:glycosyltransferase involved in cell wall biosynthesis